MNSDEPLDTSLMQLIKAFRANNLIELSHAMLNISPESRILGAEVNTIEILLGMEHSKEDFINQIFFLTSDTEEGIFSATLLKEYYSARSRRDQSLSALHTDIRVVKDLQDKDPMLFKKSGLLNLVRAISQCIHESGGPQNVIIDATGGYKAQIAIAVMFGQALGIDVMYKHEKFTAIIDFPPMPIALDFSLFDRFSDLFLLCYYEPALTLNIAELTSYFETKNRISAYSDLTTNKDYTRMKLFFEHEYSITEHLFALNHAGLIYIEAALQSNSSSHPALTLPKQLQESERKKPKLREDHYPKGFQQYVTRIWEKEKWISTVISLPYDKQRGINFRGFFLHEINGEKLLIGYYRDNDNFGARFRILTGSKTNNYHLRASLIHLNKNINNY